MLVTYSRSQISAISKIPPRLPIGMVVLRSYFFVWHSKTVQFTYASKSFKRHRQLWDRVDLGTSFLTLKSAPLPEIEVYLEFSFNLRSVAWFSFICWKTCFECAFALVMLFLSYLVKNSMDLVSVICKLALKWYLIRMCSSWLCPFNHKDTPMRVPCCQEMRSNKGSCLID